MVNCWCGNTELDLFSQGYLKCPKCLSIISCVSPPGDITQSIKDDSGFYGKNYWFNHQEKDLGYPNILVRSRVDLPERCLYWIRTLLKYKLPPAKVLELGSAHGGFVSLLRHAGFDAIGLELSPWVVDFARSRFSIPMLLGPIEEQILDEESLDVIVFMDVLEHLSDPVATIRHCLKLLKPDGILLIQTPSLPENKSYEEMKKENHPFLEQLKEEEHIYLFSPRSIQTFFHHLGVEHLLFELAIFAHYDMFLVANRAALVENLQEDIGKALSVTPGGRMIQALLDLYEKNRESNVRLQASEADRAARLEAINKLSVQLQESEVDRVARLDQINELTRLLKDSEADRAARLDQVNELTRLLKDSEADHAARLEVINKLSVQLQESEVDRAARLEVINRQNDLIQKQAEEIESFKRTFLWKVTTLFRNKNIKQ